MMNWSEEPGPPPGNIGGMYSSYGDQGFSRTFPTSPFSRGPGFQVKHIIHIILPNRTRWNNVELKLCYSCAITGC